MRRLTKVCVALEFPLQYFALKVVDPGESPTSKNVALAPRAVVAVASSTINDFVVVAATVLAPEAA